MLSDTRFISIVHRTKFKVLVLRKFLKLLPLVGGIAVLQCQKTITRTFHAIAGLVDPQEVAIIVAFDAEIGAVTVIAVANVELVSAFAAATVTAVVVFPRCLGKVDAVACAAHGTPSNENSSRNSRVSVPNTMWRKEVHAWEDLTFFPLFPLAKSSLIKVEKEEVSQNLHKEASPSPINNQTCPVSSTF